ncbi:hypothetical protein [Tumebacillus lipolyticus]|uniref:Uncharacterized protein n=1 Tax=Tumebacillus lipolyticus TaxID=1280370 RepID=A0ABW5A295_9BACL
MSRTRWVALALTVALLSGATTACSILRTPYERQKIQEKGGSLKKKAAAEAEKEKESGKGGGKQAGKPIENMMIAREKKEGEQKIHPGRAESKGEKKERVKGQGLIYILPKATKEKIQADIRKAQRAGQRNRPVQEVQQGAKIAAEKGRQAEIVPQLRYSPELSAAVSQLEGVASATVLVDAKNKAFVALHGQKKTASGDKQEQKAVEGLQVKVEGEIPQAMPERIAKKLHALDANIEVVHITANTEHVKSFQRYSGQAKKGEVNEGVHALADHIQDIWK